MMGPFDEILDLWKNRIPLEVKDSAVFINDTLELCWASAQQIFGDKASPEIAVQIYDRLIIRSKDEDRITY